MQNKVIKLGTRAVQHVKFDLDAARHVSNRGVQKKPASVSLSLSAWASQDVQVLIVLGQPCVPGTAKCAFDMEEPARWAW